MVLLFLLACSDLIFLTFLIISSPFSQKNSLFWIQLHLWRNLGAPKNTVSASSPFLKIFHSFPAFSIKLNDNFIGFAKAKRFKKKRRAIFLVIFDLTIINKKIYLLFFLLSSVLKEIASVDRTQSKQNLFQAKGLRYQNQNLRTLLFQ